MSLMSQATAEALDRLAGTKALSVLPLEAIYKLPIFVIAESAHASFVMAGSQGRLEWTFNRPSQSPSVFGWDVAADRAYIRFDSEFHTITVQELHKAIVERSPSEN